MSEKRKRENMIYLEKRKAFLRVNQFCQAWDKINEWLWWNGLDTFSSWGDYHPRSTEIHHTKKPRAKYLNDESTWLAVCRASHRWIEDNKSSARLIGLLQ